MENLNPDQRDATKNTEETKEQDTPELLRHKAGILDQARLRPHRFGR
jgi:hypothetical protein